MEPRERWNRRYREMWSGNQPGPAPILAENLHLLPATGTALDLACGLGGNALLLAASGLRVTAWDISDEAVTQLTKRAEAEGLPLCAEQRDLLKQPPEPNQFDIIVVSRFLERALCPAIAAALRAGGILFYQTFVGAGPGGPGNPAYRLSPGELPLLFAPPLEVLSYEEPAPVDAGPAPEARLVATRSMHSRMSILARNP